MTIPTEGKLLRIFVGEADRWHGKPLYEAIVVDAPENIEAFMPDLEAMVGDGLITLERSEVLLYRPGP